MAAFHISRAIEMDEQFSVFINQFARALIQKPIVDFQRASELANAIIQRQPNEASFHESNGLIQMKRKRWQEAVDALTVVLKQSENSKLTLKQSEVHQYLSEAFLELGNNEQSTRHADQAIKARELEIDEKVKGVATR